MRRDGIVVGWYRDHEQYRRVEIEVELREKTLPTAHADTRRPEQPAEGVELAITYTSGQTRKRDRAFKRDASGEPSDYSGGAGMDEVKLVTDFAAGWDPARRDRLVEIAERWHLNAARPWCQHQRELGWHEKPIDPSKPLNTYGHHFEGQRSPSWNMLAWVRPEEHPDGLMTKPCPVCGYLYGSAWVYEPLPDDVLEFVRGLSAPSDGGTNVFTCERPVEDVRLSFTWHGGQYIDVARVGAGPREVINVWDSYADTPRIERTQDAFEAKVDDWIADYGPDALAHDVRENWL